MEKIKIIIEKSSDFFSAYSENCEGIYAAGASIDEVKKDVENAIRLIKKNLPEDRWPEQIKSDYVLEYKLDVESFLRYYSKFITLTGLGTITGINPKQLSNYLTGRAVPRQKQIDRISDGLHRFASELLSINL